MSNDLIDAVNKLLRLRNLSNDNFVEKTLDKKFLGLKRKQDRVTNILPKLLYFPNVCVVIYPQTITLEILKNIKQSVEKHTSINTIHILTCVEKNIPGVHDVFHEREMFRISMCELPTKLTRDEIDQLQTCIELTSLPKMLSTDISCRFVGLVSGDVVKLGECIRIVF